MSFADDLDDETFDAPRRARHSHPKGWEPGVTFDADEIPTEITTPPIPKIQGQRWADALRDLGDDFELPAGYELRLVEAKYDPAAWHREQEFTKHPGTKNRTTRTPAVTRPVWRYKFRVVLADRTSTPVDAVRILNTLRRTPKPRVKFTGASAFVTNWNDWQLGKDAGGGTPATLERLDRYFDLSLDRAKDLGRRNLGELVILGGGDMVEGCEIYPNQSYQVDLDMRAQGNHVTSAIVAGLDRLAPHFDRVRVIAVGGNHGERRIDGKRVNRRDNADLKAFEDAAREVSRDPRLQHVTFMIANDQPALTVDVQGHIVALTHGHVYGKGKGADPVMKSYEWYKNMAAAHHPVGDATLLVGNHFHHDIVKNWGALLFVQNPAADGGSPEFADYSGTDCPPGMSTWVMNEGSRFRDYEVLR